MYYFKCRDLGWDCSFEHHASVKEDLLPRIRTHFHYAHRIDEIDPEMEKKIFSVVTEQ